MRKVIILIFVVIVVLFAGVGNTFLLEKCSTPDSEGWRVCKFVSYIDNIRNRIFSTPEDEAACEYARHESNVEIWQKYLEDFPKGRCRKEVSKFFDELACKEAQNTSSIEGWAKYLEKFPKGFCSKDAYNKSCDMAHETATIDIWGEYLKYFPDTDCAKEADEASYKYAKDKKLVSEWEKYLERFPKGLHVFEAKQEIQKLVCNEMKQINTKEKLEEYLAKYSEVVCAKEGKDKLLEITQKEDKKECENARNAKTIEKWNEYLERYPKGSCVAEGSDKIAEIKKKEEDQFCNNVRTANNIKKWEEYLAKYPDGSCAEEGKNKIESIKQANSIAAENEKCKRDNLVSDTLYGKKMAEKTWSEAKKACETSTFCGLSGWHLPNKHELRSFKHEILKKLTTSQQKEKVRQPKRLWTSGYNKDIEIKNHFLHLSRVGDDVNYDYPCDIEVDEDQKYEFYCVREIEE